MQAHVNAVGCARPPHDIHQAFTAWAGQGLVPRERLLFERMAARAGIRQRWSVLPLAEGASEEGAFYDPAGWPGTRRRMDSYAVEAPALAEAAVRALKDFDAGRITHLVVASCTGFVAPGIDQMLVARLGLSDRVERTLIGFMGCYAAVTALRTAHHIVRSEPAAQVLVVSVELSTLHLQMGAGVESLLAMLLFGDGAAAALVSAAPTGLALDGFSALALADSEELIRWTIGDTGFAMTLSGAVPGRIAEALERPDLRDRLLEGRPPADVAHWAVHAGGRSVLDAVERGLQLDPAALDHSRAILAGHGNMSSATLLFVLARILEQRRAGPGVAVAFGPGMAVESFRFHVLP